MGLELVNTDTGEIVEFDEGGAVELEAELLNHLVNPTSAKIIYAERFDKDFLEEDESTGRAVLKYVFDHINQYGKPPTQAEVETKFKRVEFEPIRSDTRWLIDQFKNRWVKNEAADIIEAAAEDIGRFDPRPAIEEAARELQKLRERIRPQNTILTNDDAEWVLDAHFQRLADMESTGAVPFGFPLIDKHLIGLKKGQLVFTIGRPKRYKSWMLVKSMVEAQKLGYTCVFFTLEMPLEEMFQRYACMVTSVGYSDFLQGNLSDKDFNYIYEKMEEVRSNDTSVKILQPPVGERHVNDLSIIAREYGADVVYIDQLKFIESDLKVAADKRFATVEKICEELKEAAREFPIYVACQFNREAANLTEMADLSKIGLSDAIGQTGDILLGLYQSKEMRQSNEMQFGVMDARAFQPAIWTIQVELSTHSNFRCTGLAGND